MRAPRINGVSLTDFAEDDVLEYAESLSNTRGGGFTLDSDDDEEDLDMILRADPRDIMRAVDACDRQEFFDRIKAEAKRLGVRV